MRYKRIAITVGDPNGIGPEIILKALATEDFPDVQFIILAPKQLFIESVGSIPAALNKFPEFEGDEYLTGDFKEKIAFVHVTGFEKNTVTIGKITQYGGLIAGQSLGLAIRLGIKNKIDAIVTAPLSKESLHLAGYQYPGHTEFLAEGFNCEDVVMLMVSGNFRVGLVTTHCALSEVPKRITIKAILKKLKITDKELRSRFGIENPKIAVSALNPHAGEAGLFGMEEIEIIAPAITHANKQGIYASGPYPGDTLFVETEKKPFDVYLAMYHDQGLIPVKQKYFGKVVNYTAGLPIVRTSPDHGTAFDIAGKNCASSSSITEAIRLAAKNISKN